MKITRFSKGLDPKVDSLLLSAIVVLAGIIRLPGALSKGLWYDELQSVTHAVLPVADLLKPVTQYDPHPPLYYIQLHVWLLFGKADVWLKLNPLMWSLLTIPAVFLVGRRIGGRFVSLLAALLFAVSPFAVHYSQEVRMYSMMMCLAAWNFYFFLEILNASSKKLLFYSFGFSLTLLAFLYSHGTGFVIVFSILAYMFIWLLERRDIPRGSLLILFLIALVVIGYIPFVLQAFGTSLGHLKKPTPEVVVDTITTLYFGPSTSPWSLTYSVLGIAIYVMSLVVGFLSRGPVRNLIFAYLVIPGVTIALLSYVLRPVWHVRALAFSSPFLCLALALVMNRSFGVTRRTEANRAWIPPALSFLSLLVFLLPAVRQNTDGVGSYNSYRNAVTYVRNQIQAGDVLYVPNAREYWGFAWYFAGPGAFDLSKENYDLSLRNHIRLVSQLAWQDIQNNSSRTWIIFQKNKDTANLDLGSSITRKSFGNIEVLLLP